MAWVFVKVNPYIYSELTSVGSVTFRRTCAISFAPFRAPSRLSFASSEVIGDRPLVDSASGRYLSAVIRFIQESSWIAFTIDTLREIHLQPNLPWIYRRGLLSEKQILSVAEENPDNFILNLHWWNCTGIVRINRSIEILIGHVFNRFETWSKGSRVAWLEVIRLTSVSG